MNKLFLGLMIACAVSLVTFIILSSNYRRENNVYNYWYIIAAILSFVGILVFGILATKKTEPQAAGMMAAASTSTVEEKKDEDTGPLKDGYLITADEDGNLLHTNDMYIEEKTGNIRNNKSYVQKGGDIVVAQGVRDREFVLHAGDKHVNIAPRDHETGTADWDKGLKIGRDGNVRVQGNLRVDGNGNTTIAATGGALPPESAWPNGWGKGLRTWDILAASIKTVGGLRVGGDIKIGNSKKIHSDGRMHIHGEERLYLLNKNGVIVGKEWGGNGNLDVQGQLKAGTICIGGTCINEDHLKMLAGTKAIVFKSNNGEYHKFNGRESGNIDWNNNIATMHAY